MTYAVFATSSDADYNANANAVCAKVSDSTATADDSDGGDNFDDAIVATADDAESDSNAVVNVVVASNANFFHDLKNLIRT